MEKETITYIYAQSNVTRAIQTKAKVIVLNK